MTHFIFLLDPLVQPHLEVVLDWLPPLRSPVSMPQIRLLPKDAIYHCSQVSPASPNPIMLLHVPAGYTLSFSTVD